MPAEGFPGLAWERNAALCADAKDGHFTWFKFTEWMQVGRTHSAAILGLQVLFGSQDFSSENSFEVGLEVRYPRHMSHGQSSYIEAYTRLSLRVLTMAPMTISGLRLNRRFSSLGVA